jgi:hypothetical protein
MDLLLDALPGIAGEVFTSGPMAYNQPWTALINHYSERFADQAAAIAHHVCYLTTGHAAQPVHCVSWVGTAHDPPAPDVDPVLSALVAAMDTVPERHDGGPSITLVVNGVIISGQVIAGWQWFHAEQLRGSMPNSSAVMPAVSPGRS